MQCISLDTQNHGGESVIKMKNGKAAGPSELVTEMVKSPREAGVDTTTGKVHQIKVKVFPEKWELITIVNWYKEKFDALESIGDWQSCNSWHLAYLLRKW